MMTAITTKYNIQDPTNFQYQSKNQMNGSETQNHNNDNEDFKRIGGPQSSMDEFKNQSENAAVNE